MDGGLAIAQKQRSESLNRENEREREEGRTGLIDTWQANCSQFLPTPDSRPEPPLKTIIQRKHGTKSNAIHHTYTHPAPDSLSSTFILFNDTSANIRYAQPNFLLSHPKIRICWKSETDSGTLGP